MPGFYSTSNLDFEQAVKPQANLTLYTSSV